MTWFIPNAYYIPIIFLMDDLKTKITIAYFLVPPRPIVKIIVVNYMYIKNFNWADFLQP